MEEKGNAIVLNRAETLKNASKAEALGDPSFIQELLDLHDKYKGIVGDCFVSFYVLDTSTFSLHFDSTIVT